MKTKSEVTHTPTPWTYGKNSFGSYTINREDARLPTVSNLSKEDAAFIVRSCNNFEKAEAGIKKAIKLIEKLDVTNETSEVLGDLYEMVRKLQSSEA